MILIQTSIVPWEILDNVRVSLIFVLKLHCLDFFAITSLMRAAQWNNESSEENT